MTVNVSHKMLSEGMLFSPELRNSSRCKLHQSTLILFLVVYDSPNPLQEKYERSRENARKRYK